jgi:hypothetical protein
MDNVPDSKHYFWAVRVGSVEVWRQDGQVLLRSGLNTPSDSPVCALTNEDALEIATLLYHLAKGTPGY